MADRWMDERDREMRDRDWRRSERYGRSSGRGGGDERRSWDDGDEGRSYGGGAGGGRDRVFGERESGANYGAPRYGRFEGWRAGGGFEGYGRDVRPGEDEDTAWQRRDYGGVSPAMAHGEYELERRAGRRGDRGYERGGRYLGDDGRERIYRQEYGQGGVEYGREPRGYDAEREDNRRRDHRRGHFAEDYFFRGGDMSGGGTGGYDYERGYGEGPPERDLSRGRYYGEDRRDEHRRGEGDSSFERGARDTGDFFRRAGERVASWFGAGDAGRDQGRDRSHRGRGPKDYQRPDERISEDAHERLTDDQWLDASNISISVSAGEVTLSGTVENREAKHRAERIVEDISGVKHVQNNLRVDEGSYFTSPSRGYGDSVLEAQMREARPEGGQSNEGAQGRSGRSRGAGQNLSS